MLVELKLVEQRYRAVDSPRRTLGPRQYVLREVPSL